MLLIEYIVHYKQVGKVIIWEHNSENNRTAIFTIVAVDGRRSKIPTPWHTLQVEIFLGPSINSQVRLGLLCILLMTSA